MSLIDYAETKYIDIHGLDYGYQKWDMENSSFFHDENGMKIKIFDQDMINFIMVLDYNNNYKTTCLKQSKQTKLLKYFLKKIKYVVKENDLNMFVNFIVQGIIKEKDIIKINESYNHKEIILTVLNYKFKLTRKIKYDHLFEVQYSPIIYTGNKKQDYFDYSRYTIGNNNKNEEIDSVLVLMDILENVYKYENYKWSKNKRRKLSRYNKTPLDLHLYL